MDGMAAALRNIEGKTSMYHQMGTRAQRRVAPEKPADSDDEDKGARSTKEKKNKRGEKAKKKQPTQRAPEPASTPTEDTQHMDHFGVSDFGKAFCMAGLLELTSTEKLINEQRCGLCNRQNGVVDPVILQVGFIYWPQSFFHRVLFRSTDSDYSKCKHVFCSNCFMRRVLKPQMPNCPVEGCAGKVEGWGDAKTLSSQEGECHLWDAADDEDGEETEAATRPAAKLSRKQKSEAARRKRQKKKRVESKYGADYNGNLPITAPDDKAFVRIGVNTPDGVPCPSAKITCAKDILIQWQEDGPDDKIISEWSPIYHSSNMQICTDASPSFRPVCQDRHHDRYYAEPRTHPVCLLDGHHDTN